MDKTVNKMKEEEQCSEQPAGDTHCTISPEFLCSQHTHGDNSIRDLKQAEEGEKGRTDLILTSTEIRTCCDMADTPAKHSKQVTRTFMRQVASKVLNQTSVKWEVRTIN